jgi:hypothetical protein
LRAAEELGADFVEADVWFAGGRIEVRHLRTFGRLHVPLLWERWRLVPGWGKRLTLPDLLAVSAPRTGLMLDLKGVDARLAPNLIEAMATLAPERLYAVSTRRWQLLEAFREHGHVLVIHAAGDQRELHEVRNRLDSHDHYGVAVDHRLLTPARVSELRKSAPVLFAWTVNDESRMRQLVEWGVNGIISDRHHVLRAVLQLRRSAAE